MIEINEFERIVTLYGKELYRYCYKRLDKNKQLADETYGDVLRVLFQKWDSLDKDANIRAYLFRTAELCLKHNRETYNRYYTRNSSLEEALEEGGFTENACMDSYFEEDYEEDRLIDEVERSLPEEYRQIFRYRFAEHKTISEVASLTGIPYSSLRLRLAKIEVLVREKIKKMFN